MLVLIFPEYSETFITGEIRRLRRRGLDVRPVGIVRSRDADRFTDHETLARLRREEGLSPYYLSDRQPGSLSPRLVGLVEALRNPVGAARLALANARLPIPAAWPRRGRLLMTLLLRRWMVREGISWLHCHWTLPTDIALLLKTAYGTPFSMAAHAGDIYDDPMQTGLGPLRKKLCEAEFIVIATAKNREYLAGLAPECASKLHLIYNGVDLGLFDGRRSRPGGRLPLVLSVGRLVDKKRFSVLLRACRQAVDQGVELRCVIVGEGPERSELEERRDTLGLQERVRFTGALEPGKVRAWLSRADLFVLTPDTRTHYGIPNVFYEAMAMGVPVLANRLPGMEEVLGYGVFVHTDAELCSELVELLDDRPRRERLAAAARNLVEREFDAEVWADRLAGLLSDAQERHLRPSNYERAVAERAAL